MEADEREPKKKEEEAEPSAVEEAAGKKLGVREWDRPLIFRDAADAAVDNGLPYWLVLILSGAIATLGLAMNSAAVVIGAMLVAPLLGPIMGLSMALAVGDSRLALQSFAVVAGSVIVVVATAAGLTALLPFQTITLEISSRIRPTTLDLAVAVCSGLVGAVVTVARGERLSAAIPGVAVAVALIPPMGVAGFGMAAGWQTDVIWGALLLLGANMAGIVLSGVALFLLVGMHRAPVVEAAREWHKKAVPRGVARQVCRLPGVGRMEVFGSALGRVGLVLGFVAALAIPLTVTLREVVREARVGRAVSEALEVLEADGGTSVLWQEIELGGESATVRVRVATTAGVGGDARDEFRRHASEIAGEPVTLSLEQLPASAGDAASLQALLRGGDGASRGGGRAGQDDEPTWPETVARARAALEEATWSLPFPEGTEAIGATLAVSGGDATGPADSVEIAYLAPAALEPAAEEVLRVALRRAVGHPGLKVGFERAGPAVVELEPGETEALVDVIAVLQRFPGLRVGIRNAVSDSAVAAAALEALRSAGVDSVDVETPSEAGPAELRVRRRSR